MRLKLTVSVRQKYSPLIYVSIFFFLPTGFEKKTSNRSIWEYEQPTHVEQGLHGANMQNTEVILPTVIDNVLLNQLVTAYRFIFLSAYYIPSCSPLCLTFPRLNYWPSALFHYGKSELIEESDKKNERTQTSNLIQNRHVKHVLSRGAHVIRKFTHLHHKNIPKLRFSWFRYMFYTISHISLMIFIHFWFDWGYWSILTCISQ